MEEQQAAGRVTLDNVRAAVEQLGGDPTRTNAAKVREVLGRGGYSTIQKHLESLRVVFAEPEAENGPETAPEAPQELLMGIWAAAWAEAARGHGKALNGALQRERETGERLTAALDDLDALVADLDQVQADLAKAQERAAAAEGELQAERERMAGERQTMAAVMERLEAMLPKASVTA
jgi:hypothetical protein